MFVTSPDYNSDSSLTELFQYSSKALLQKVVERSPHFSAPTSPQLDTRLGDWEISSPPSHETRSRPGFSSPATSAALRDRDLEMLEELFGHEDMEHIQADIQHNLELLSPELCWEEDPFDFLRDYL